MFEGQSGLIYQTPSFLIFSRKLDTALRHSTIRAFQDKVRNDKLTRDVHLITHHFSPVEILSAIDGQSLYAMTLRSIISDSDQKRIRYTHGVTSWLRSTVSVANQNIEVQTAWMLSQA